MARECAQRRWAFTGRQYPRSRVSPDGSRVGRGVVILYNSR